MKPLNFDDSDVTPDRPTEVALRPAEYGIYISARDSAGYMISIALSLRNLRLLHRRLGTRIAEMGRVRKANGKPAKRPAKRRP